MPTVPIHKVQEVQTTPSLDPPPPSPTLRPLYLFSKAPNV